MKKILYLLLLSPIIYLVSCSSSKDGLSPQSLESIIVGTEWCLSNDNEDGFLLAEDGRLFVTQKCQPNYSVGEWIINGNQIMNRYTEGTGEITTLWAEVTEYSENQIKILESADSTTTLVSIYTLDTTDIYGCMDVSASNYNPAAECDDGSCIECALCHISYIANGVEIEVEIGEFCGSELEIVEDPGYSHTIEETIVGMDTVQAGTYSNIHCEEHYEHTTKN